MENLIVMSYYKKPEDPAPTFLYVMDGMKSYKVWLIIHFVYLLLLFLILLPLISYDLKAFSNFIDRVEF